MDLWMKGLSIVGFVLLVVAYLLNQNGRLKADEPPYLAMNTCGAAMLAAYSYFIGETVFVALEGFWSVASGIAWWRRGWGRKRG